MAKILAFLTKNTVNYAEKVKKSQKYCDRSIYPGSPSRHFTRSNGSPRIFFQNSFWAHDLYFSPHTYKPHKQCTLID
jgi:hypothetical protein